MGTGLMSLAEFEHQVKRFVNISNRINDDWQLVRANNGSLYMMKKNVVEAPQSFSSNKEMPFEPMDASKSCAVTRENDPVLTSCASPLRTITSHVSFAKDIAKQSETTTNIPLLAGAPNASTQNHALQLEQKTNVIEVGKHSDNKAKSTLSPKTFHAIPENELQHEDRMCHIFQDQERGSELLLASQNQAAVSPIAWIQTAHLVHSPDNQGALAIQERSNTKIKEAEVFLDRHQLENVGTAGQSSINTYSTCLEDMESEMESDTEDDAFMLMCQQQGTPLTYEYHVVYSESYCVPVLYFNVFTPDGKLLPLNEVWKLCPQSYQSFIEENKWATLTQQEHPLLGRPYLQLHPCHTGDLMAQVTRGKGKEQGKHYLATWLSTVGPLTALQISPAYIFE
ncbi:ubiquitin-like-conjugating enzyme atg10 [Plakobranchus ocellatus]|uniref:Ubiquitin-like-conjugating enzyme ATG10 n=1 Tax=Plakobranchus ocellatus TaxID=259542 RepID=A0AAV4BH62_9GAST|nr:ubiquitin-like-conjugating enzyme atg10 [Plakobranchus ocellatus]